MRPAYRVEPTGTDGLLDRPPSAAKMNHVEQSSTSRLLLEAFRSLEGEIQLGLADRDLFDLRPSHAAALLLVDRGGSRLTDLAGRAGGTGAARGRGVQRMGRWGG